MAKSNPAVKMRWALGPLGIPDLGLYLFAETRVYIYMIVENAYGEKACLCYKKLSNTYSAINGQSPAWR